MSPAGLDLSKVIEQVMRGPGSEVPLTLHISENLCCLKHKLSAPDCVLQLWKSGFLIVSQNKTESLGLMECRMTLEWIVVCLRAVTSQWYF